MAILRSKAKREEDGYAAIAPGYDALHKEEQLRKIGLIVAHLEIRPNDRLLDVGCGTGFSLPLWPCTDVTGVEPSEAMIRQAPPRVQARIIHARAEDLSVFNDHEFDVVVSVTAVHNFTGVADGLREMLRVGKGRFAFSILKKSAKLDEIDREIRALFAVKEILDDPHDRVYICVSR